MIKFVAVGGNKNIIGLGLSHRNLELLKQGKPIYFPATEILHGKIKQITEQDEFFIFSEVDEEKMKQKLESTKIDMSETVFRDFRTDHSGKKT